VLTEAFGWRSIFYVNIVPGIAVTALTILFVRVDKADVAMLKRIDYVHLVAMAAFLGGLEYVLEEGPRYQWLDDPVVATAAWLSLVGFGLFLERSLRSQAPVVRLSPFREPTFVFACLFNLVIGFGLYSATYLVPLFLGRVRGYDSLQIGTTVFVTGIAQIASTLVAARLSQRVDPRAMIAVGLPLFAASLWLASYLTPEWGFAALLLPQALRGLAIMLCIVPSVTLALGGFAGAELRGIGLVQPHAQPRRRDRHRGRQHLAAGRSTHPRRALRRKPRRGRARSAGNRRRARRPLRCGDQRRRARAARRPGRDRARGRARLAHARLQRRVPPDGVDVPRRTRARAAVPAAARRGGGAFGRRALNSARPGHGRADAALAITTVSAAVFATLALPYMSSATAGNAA
jgi:hypothetical protein